jgi:hypothetical protein
MPETNATILIPDISGFTKFMTTTELNHASYAINMLIESILNAVGDEYEVSEIEGDAVLLIKKGPPPSQKEVMDICLKIFNAFHFQRKWMQQYTICPCEACLAIAHLTLKFVVHHGPLAEIKVGRFVKQSGPEMIVAHRLLKNGIANNEYLLMTEKLPTQGADASNAVEMQWTSSSEEYDSIGKINYRYTLLKEARKNVPEPPEPKNDYLTDNTSYLEIPVAANFREVYMVIMNIPERYKWIPELESIAQDMPDVYVGSIHHFKFKDYQAIVSPLRMTYTGREVIYAESCQIESLGLSLVYEFIFNKTGENTCLFGARFMNAGLSAMNEEMNAAFFKKLEQMAQGLKTYCEKMEIA